MIVLLNLHILHNFFFNCKCANNKIPFVAAECTFFVFIVLNQHNTIAMASLLWPPCPSNHKPYRIKLVFPRAPLRVEGATHVSSWRASSWIPNKSHVEANCCFKIYELRVFCFWCVTFLVRMRCARRDAWLDSSSCCATHILCLFGDICTQLS